MTDQTIPPVEPGRQSEPVQQPVVQPVQQPVVPPVLPPVQQPVAPPAQQQPYPPLYPPTGQVPQAQPGLYQQPAQPSHGQPQAQYQQQPTFLQTVPTAIYQAPSTGGYPAYQGEYHGPGARQLPQTSTRAVWALVTGIIGLVISIFVGWGFPFSIAAIVLGFLSRQRETTRRGFALTGIVTGFVGLVLSAGWLTYSIVTIIGYLRS
ncbi:DUF4190 domain-containing protein [Plantibacter sp. Mn2098]|uniref:DUF4190 domain-containing protein n=1 Tax=Plantibacter sp. Mn2098 TaxID=3395266 RepID=UPI003BCBB1A6